MRSALLSLQLTLTLVAGVTYDQTVRNGDLDAPLALEVKSRVPSIDPPVFDISPNLYAPPLDHAPTVSFKILVEGDRLVRIGKDVSVIFDLKARTVTVVQPKTHSYSVETFDQAEQRVWAPFKPLHSERTFDRFEFTSYVQKTGRTRQIQGQSAEEYRIIEVELLDGRRFVNGSAVYWMVPKPPSDELAAFELRWSREFGLPFPGMPPTQAAGDAYFSGTMAAAASKLPGYPILYVLESRPFPGAPRIATPAEKNNPTLVAAEIDQVKIGVRETAFSGLAAAAVAASAFTVPAGYKESKSLRYMPDWPRIRPGMGISRPRRDR